VRKLVLIAAFALVSAAAQAAERIDRVPAENDAPVAAAPVAAAPPPAAAPAAAATPAPVAEPQTARKQAYSNQNYRKQALGAQAFRSGTTLRASHERQARRIAAAYGISW
jgi:membrane-bound lytic murein transglycosylase B